MFLPFCGGSYTYVRTYTHTYAHVCIHLFGLESTEADVDMDRSLRRR